MASDLVFLQLIVRPNILQDVERLSNMVVRSDQLSTRRALSLPYSRLVIRVFNLSILLFPARLSLCR